jgi:cytoskeletal protein CcmA (bactofilin family)
MPNTLLTGYNSADPADTDIDVKIGTTGTLSDRIPLGPGTVVDGDVFVGVGGDPSVVVGAGGTITGEKYALTEEPEFPVITPPPLPDMGTDLSADSTTLTIGPADSGKYTAITLSGGGGAGVLEIDGGDVALHITGNIDVGNGCEVIVREGSSLTIYADGDLYADNSMGFNNEPGNVEDFALYGTGEGEQEFALKAKSNVFGVVYAPNANITLYPSSEIHGALVGNNVTIKSGGTFYYDEALKALHDVGARFVVQRWYEE